jgi:putative hydrolase of the HAD superfamily
MIEAVLFDVDGVLVHSGKFAARMARELGLSRGAMEAFWHGPFASCALGAADLKEQIAPFLRQWGYRGSAEDCLRAWFEADSALNQPVLDAAQRLRARGMPCHIVSTQERYRAEYLEGPMGLAQHFDRLFFSCHLGVKKPQPEFYQRVTGELGLAPDALLLIDDQQPNIDAARAAGWHAEIYAFGDDLGVVWGRHGIPLQHG